MGSNLRVAIIGLDTSHSVEFPRLMQSPDCPVDTKVNGLEVATCLRFPSAFQSEEGQDERQKTLEGWGVKVTTDFDEAVADCDVIFIEINDPALHLEYFTKCADLGKPMFLDKPMADTLENGQKIFDMAKAKNLKVCSASSLRFVPSVIEACNAMPSPMCAAVCGPLGRAPAGSGLVWYGVHAMEMLQRAMGRGAESLIVQKDDLGATVIVKYPEKRRGVVELSTDSFAYCGMLRDRATAVTYSVDMSNAYYSLLTEIAEFVLNDKKTVSMEETFEVMALLDAARRSYDSGVEEKLWA